MKTQKSLQKTGLTIFIVLLAAFLTHAQIPIKGLHADHEGSAAWNADGSGPEPAATGHQHPFGFGNVMYYTASCDYDGIDSDPDAALAHVEGEINGFPLFEQALADHGYLPGQVKVKMGISNIGNDQEGEDWFTMDNQHHFNYYNGNFVLELGGEAMIGGIFNIGFLSYNQSVPGQWQMETNFSKPTNASSNSSAAVQAVAAAFLADLNGMELRLVYNTLQSTMSGFEGNGRFGEFFEIVSGSLEKGLPQLPFTGLASDHEGIASWNADGSGPEPENYGHTYTWGGNEYQMPYYTASRDYDNIDPDHGAALGHFSENPTGFPNLMRQLQYRGYALEQLQLKSGLGTLGNDEQGSDWGLTENMHWWRSYGNVVTIEIDGEPIVEYMIDTNFNSENMNYIYWTSQSSFSTPQNISEFCSTEAQHVAASFFKDLSGHLIRSYMEGSWNAGFPDTNGRVNGRFDNLTNAYLEGKQPKSTHIWGGEVSGMWTLENSPYVIMNEINVPDGLVLDIEAGVEVRFATTKAFTINGCINTNGTPENPVLFTAYDPSVPWGGIEIPDNDTTTNTPISLSHCIFEYAYAYNPDNLYGYNCGGAIRVDDYEQIEISHCTFRYNGAENDLSNSPAGGAIMISHCSIKISHCIFHDNYSFWGGALAILDHSSPTIDNCLFYNNESNFGDAGCGGAVMIWTECKPHFVNCNFVNNHASNVGGAVEIELGGKTSFTNCIFWGNTAENGASQISVWDPAINTLNVYHSNVEDDSLGITPGFQGAYIGNINMEPEFITVGDYIFVPDTVNSPCLNAGTENVLYLPENYTFPEYCLGGNTRIFDGEVDMGCYESPVLLSRIRAKEKLNNRTVNIFPNPFKTNPVIEIDLQKDAFVQIKILNISGSVIVTLVNDVLPSGKKQFKLNADNLKPGIYFCSLIIGNESYFERIIKM